jgi:hypothetical protein
VGCAVTDGLTLPLQKNQRACREQFFAQPARPASLRLTWASHTASETSSRPCGLRTGSPPSPPPRSIRPAVRLLPRSPRFMGPGPPRSIPESCGKPFPVQGNGYPISSFRFRLHSQRQGMGFCSICRICPSAVRHESKPVRPRWITIVGITAHFTIVLCIFLELLPI